MNFVPGIGEPKVGNYLSRIALYKQMYGTRIVYSAGVVSTSAPPRRANSIYHRPVFRPTFIVTHAVLVWPRGRMEGHGRERFGSRGVLKRVWVGELGGWGGGRIRVLLVRTVRGTLCAPRRVKIPSSTLPRAVVKDVICLMRFDTNRLPRYIYINIYTHTHTHTYLYAYEWCTHAYRTHKD